MDVWELDGFSHGFRYSSEIPTTSLADMVCFCLDTWHYRLAGAPGAAAGVEDWSTSRCTCASASCVFAMCVCISSIVHCTNPPYLLPSSFVSSASVSTTVRNQNTIPPDLVSAFFDRSTTGLLAAAKDLASFRLNNLRRQVVDDFKAVLLSISSPAIESVWGAL